MSDERLDRFARGELSPAESRELARNTLDDPALFDELTYIAVARKGLEQRPRRRNIWLPAALFAAAAAVVAALVAVNSFRSPSSVPAAVTSNLASPVFLARAADSSTVFRGPEPESRPPRLDGRIISIEDRVVNIDLGSLDGLAKSGEIEVLRDGTTIGKVKLTTIFRERARAEVPPGLKIQVNDAVRASSEMQVRAELDQIAACAARNDSEGARRIAERAVIAENPSTVVSDYADWNNLAAIAHLRGDQRAAQSLYQQALRAGPSPEARRAIENNLLRVKGAR
jgi:hypothetical protein